MSTQASTFIVKQPVARDRCLDCRADFARHRAVQRLVDTILHDGELEVLVCPECGSYAVQEDSHESH